jgi:hypothetical protein
MDTSGFYLWGCIYLFTPPTVITPLLEARQRENTLFYPFQGECLLNNYYSKFDYRFGAKPKIPFAFC